ncbi:hypothetical protein Ddye_023354 [Dipteronia dyeriana]|uniref:Uncharacterized protein n=1 Tax=Dipteronia dyeriana TaxID=168575 RepID=A0AAD9TSX6_9ROSI|nr:hypothetical protein Ddye_023354 [Dipteronia dyeriana]
MARGTMAASSSNNQGESFNWMGLEHFSAAAEGDFEKFEHSDSKALAKILTPNDNTILHIHITARPESSTSQENKTVKLLEDGDFVRRVLGKCSDLLRKVNSKGETLLHMAARYGHADVAKFLLEECKKNPLKKNDDDPESGITITSRMLETLSHETKDTALHEAVRYGHLDVVKLLTEEDGEFPYDANTAGETPLYLAAERGYADVLDQILKTCTSPADHGPYDRTALHVAVIRKDEDMVEILLKAGERIHISKQGPAWMDAASFRSTFRIH